MGNCCNSRANTCASALLVGGAVYIGYKTSPTFRIEDDLQYMNEARDLSRCYVNKVSDLSAFDGRVLAYRGIDG